MKNLALLVVLAGGCAKTESSDLLTHGMYAGITARAQGTGSTTVTATLYVGNPINLNFVDLTGDDALVATHNAETRVMNEVELLNVVSHQTVFQGDAPGGEYVVDFQRTVDNGAPQSVATLPDPFTLVVPPGTASRAAELTVSWSNPTADPMAWSASGDCIDVASGQVTANSDHITIAANTLKKRQAQQVADSCAIKIGVTRTNIGVLDTHYGKGGSVTGEQYRELSFTSTP